jgi:hypothetical protein
MTFKQAMRKAKQGHRVRDDTSMAKGWTVAYFKDVKDFFNINPRTGTNYHFTPTSAQKASTTWQVQS